MVKGSPIMDRCTQMKQEINQEYPSEGRLSQVAGHKKLVMRFRVLRVSQGVQRKR